MKPLRHWFRSTSCLKDFFFSPPQQNHELFYSTSRVPVSLRHGVIYRHSFPVCCFNLLLFSSSRDRDGKAAKDEKGKDVFREGKKKFSGVLVFLILLLFGKHVY